MQILEEQYYDLLEQKVKARSLRESLVPNRASASVDSSMFEQIPFEMQYQIA